MKNPKKPDKIVIEIDDLVEEPEARKEKLVVDTLADEKGEEKGDKLIINSVELISAENEKVSSSQGAVSGNKPYHQIPLTRCQSCGIYLEKDAGFCSNCGLSAKPWGAKTASQQKARKRGRRLPVTLVAALMVLLIGGGITAVILSLTGSYSASGRVVNDQGEGVGSVAIEFEQGLGEVKTDENGYWYKDGLSGAVTVIPKYGRAIFNPVRTEISTEVDDISFTILGETEEGYTSSSGEFTAYSTLTAEEEVEVTVIVEDLETGEPLEGINVEVVVYGDKIVLILHDLEGNYLPEIIVLGMENLENYPGIEIKRGSLYLRIAAGLGAVVLDVTGTVLYIAGGVAVFTGAGTLPGFTAIALAVGMNVTSGLLKAYAFQEDDEKAEHPLTIYIFESRDSSQYVELKVPSGATFEDIVEAVEFVVGDREIEILAPEENPAGAYYNDDGNPKYLTVYPIGEGSGIKAAPDPAEKPEPKREANQVMVSCGEYHSLALLGDGKVLAWGDNRHGQLGDNNGGRFGAYSALPIQLNFNAGIKAISAGDWHSLAVKDDGTVWAWGNNSSGRLGDGTTENKLVPTKINGLNNMVAVSAGAEHSLALREDGTVWAWGNNRYGQLGDGSHGFDAGKNKPVQVKGPGGSGFLSDIVAVSAGRFHSMAVKSDGTVWSWGRVYEGQLGEGSSGFDPDRSVPVQVKGPGGKGFLTGVIAVSAGSSHSLAVKSDGTVWSWGNNYSGRLGDGSTRDRMTPVQVKGAAGKDYLTGVIAVSAGSSHTLAAKGDGTVWAWGYNENGQLGDGGSGFYAEKHMPVQVTGPGGLGNLTGVVAISAGRYHSLSINRSDNVWAWGSNNSGELGNGNNEHSTVPVQSLIK